ncbi:hypothetical protein K432DRAFT_302548, partial [Lepidopterella palustris CBS 459.81]
VSLVGDIYRKAAFVVTYIGLESGVSQEGIQFARDLCDYAENCDKRLLHAIQRLRRSRFLGNGFPPPEHFVWQTVRLLLRHSWSGRVWIIQESLLNEKLQIICGRQHLQWCLLGCIAYLDLNLRIPTFAATDCLPVLTISFTKTR